MTEYDNLIIMAHAKDETIFFYDFITPRSVVLLLTKPYLKHDEDIMKDVIIRKGATLITFNVVEGFDINFKLDNDTKKMLKSYISSTSIGKIITLGNIAKDIDPQNREIYSFINGLNLKNHYMVHYDVTGKKQVSRTVIEYMNRYASSYKLDKQRKIRMDAYLDTYTKITGLKRV